MGNRAARVIEPTLVAGNKNASLPVRPSRWIRTSGFTLIELLVVVALIAIASTGASLALRDSADAMLEREAQRLAAMLEAARVEARANDALVFANLSPQGIEFSGLDKNPSRQSWLAPTTAPATGVQLVLGPEPILPPQQVELRSLSTSPASVWVFSDGLRPWTVQRSAPGNRP